MKKSTIIIIVVVALLAIWGVRGYNGLVTMDENVSGQWSNVETQYQRRADLIPNLVNTVKGYASHEKETLEGVVEARSKATQMTVDANDLTPEKLAEYQKAQGAVTSALGKLLAITENYPDLKANQNFLELQAQLEGTENRINVARTNFNNAAKNFNTAIRRFPKNILAGLFGFEKRAYFEAAEGSEQAPKAQGAVTSALGKLLAITENYPDLKANQNFLELQAQLEGTENRINVARTNFNNAAKNFNTAIRRFPKNILAGLFGFEKRAYFEAAEGSEQAPKVEF